jgi:hypothetical protein
MVGGDLLAVWPNGVVEFSPDLQWGQRTRRVGRVDPERVTQLMGDLEDIGFFAIEGTLHAGSIDDGQMDVIVRTAGRTMQWSNDESPLVARNALGPASYRAWDPIIEGTWQLAGKLLRQIIPDESWPL